MAKDKKKHTALYIRVSTDFQFEEGYSVEAQQKKLKQWCKLKDVKNYEFYIDGGFSGSNLRRPRMTELIQEIEQDKIDAVVVYKLDRLSRSQKDTIYLLEDVFIPHNVGFMSLNENFDTATPYGKAMVGILSVFAQLERENIRERTRMGMYERIKSGLWRGGGTTPFGYDYDPQKNTLVPNEHADDVRRIFELYNQGYSTTQLAKMFDVSGDRQITQILDRVTYLGKISYKGEIIDGIHQPLIDQKTFDEAQRMREKRTTKGVSASEYLLTGLLYCGKCGAKMRYQKWGKGLKIYCYSQDKSKSHLIKDPNCNNPKYDAKLVEAKVLDVLFDKCDELVASNKPPSPNTDTNALETLNLKKEKLSSKIRKLYNLYAEDEGDLLLETIRENEFELRQINSMIENVKKIADEKSAESSLLIEVKNLRNRWSTMTIKEQKYVLHNFVERIELDGDNIDLVISV